MNIRIGRWLIVAVAALSLAACGSTQLTETPNTDPDLGVQHLPASSTTDDGGLSGNIFGQ